ncbi:polysaccharide deacetylase family protein [Planctomicrobium sp. SH661]|uniref:polysaccharide deacetylase family protein n=1 Tax=Planctomicrobium sp. SH661 TaxID=3448124 RepID=UPI003F5BEEAE
MKASPGLPQPLTWKSKLRDWLGTQVPRHGFSRLPRVLSRIPHGPGEQVLSLTFDDGPHPTGTPALLDVLSVNNVRATFFLLGERAQRYPELVREILAEGHEIGNHSWSHADFWKCTKTHLLVELSRCQHLLSEIAAEPVHWMRPPYGHVSYTARAWARRNDSTVVLWDLLPPDYNPGSDVARLKSVYQRFIRPGSVVCLHDNDVSQHVTPQLLRSLIPQAREAGWSFRGLSCP